MSVGLLIITHEQIGSVLIETATTMLAACPLEVEVVPVFFDSDPDEILKQANKKVGLLDKGDGVLVLTDMYGSTPSNVATKLLAEHERLALVAGINLPMLVRLLNYPDSTLQQLVDKALTGGRDGVLRCASDSGIK